LQTEARSLKLNPVYFLKHQLQTEARPLKLKSDP
jgi:hypothetical protein